MGDLGGRWGFMLTYSKARPCPPYGVQNKSWGADGALCLLTLRLDLILPSQ